MEAAERVARGMCKSEGKDPEADYPTGKMETISRGGTSFEYREVIVPLWKTYEAEAKRFIAAHDALANRNSEQ